MCFALLFVGLVSDRVSNRWVIWAGNCFIMGIIFFLRVVVYSDGAEGGGISPMKIVGIATPVGGVFFIAGWLFLWLGVRRNE